MVAGMLERRCYAKPMMRPVYPNLFTLLVAPPGIGKSTVIAEVVRFWRKTERVNVAPNSVTSASLVDVLRESGHVVTNSKTFERWTYHSLLIGSEEFGNLINSYDLGFMSGMCEFYDCVALYSELRRGRKRDEQPPIPHPQLHMLAGTTPKYLGAALPESAWGQGFMSRNILIYAGSQARLPLFVQHEANDILERKIIEDLRTVASLEGEFTWTPEASTALVDWWEAELSPAPAHLRLEDYKPRRLLHFVKLCMAFSAARSNDLRISLDDHNLAKKLLLDAEAQMPQIFQAMASTDDTAIVEEVYTFVLRQHARTKKPVSRPLVLEFMAELIPLYRIENFIKVMEDARIIVRVGGGYTPGRRSKFDTT